MIETNCKLHKSYEQLEQENEKLDKQIDTMLEDCKRCTYRKTSEQLEQAKKIINEFMRISVASVEEYEPEFTELIEQAEQFLEEIEK